jgi:hypothetical protein
MTAGLSAANLANKWLDMLGGTAFTAPSAFYVKLHTGDPGSAGTANASAVTTREAVSWSSASGGSKSESAAPTSWSMTTTETISYVSFWDASTSGNFLGSAALSTSRSVISGDTLTLSTLTIALSPVAA